MMGDYAVQESGGIDGASFGQGWAIAAAFFSTLGAFLWRVLSRAKDQQIKLLVQRIKHLEEDIIAERRQCREDIEALNTRIKVLEAMTLGNLRQQTQTALSEQRMDARRHPD